MVCGAMPSSSDPHRHHREAHRMKRRVVLLSLVAAAPLAAQSAPRALTAADYARAERFMAYNVAPLVRLPSVRPTWLADGRFWYRDTASTRSEFVLVDPVRRTRARAFDHGRLAAALGRGGGAG